MIHTLTEPFDPFTCSEKELTSWYELMKEIRLGFWPDEPVLSLESTLNQLEAGKKLRRVIRRAVWTPDRRMAGHCFLSSPLMNEESGLRFVYLGVVREWRRKGIGAAMLGWAMKEASHRNWNKLLLETGDRCPEGEFFVRHFNGKPVSSAGWNRLTIREADRPLMDRWAQGGNEVDLELWKGSVPQERLQEYIDLHQLIHDEKRDEPGFREYTFTAADLRRREESNRAQGRVKMTLAALDRQQGKLVGLTVMSWIPDMASVVSQGYTAVLPEARGKGIAKRLKAEMLGKLTCMNPEARFVKAGNATCNAPILRMNQLMGFRRALTTTNWELEI